MIKAATIRRVRKALGESQTAFGRRFGVNQSTVHRWEFEGIPKKGATRIAVAHVLSTLDPKEEIPLPGRKVR